LCGAQRDFVEDGQAVVEIVVQFGTGGEHAAGVCEGGDAGVGDDAEEGAFPSWRNCSMSIRRSWMAQG
jgi:hypothetical protein